MYYTFLKCIANICKRAETAKFSALTKVKACFNYCVFQKFLYGHYIIKLFTHAREKKIFAHHRKFFKVAPIYIMK